ncbi:hypothetical protein D9V37_02380 [Nocardioides mangrovicus]|uniref:Uncharacterized protein n=1 Tax=Nocardioides mangrovicus TaxID=2478913 RepID=A0A3L8P6T1_9ACTN|nr:hypothetical protein D9V37_02380 [Nocardioides mangrovicus]
MMHVAFEASRTGQNARVTAHAFEQSATDTLCGCRLDRLEWLAFESVDFDEVRALSRCRACQALALSWAS